MPRYFFEIETQETRVGDAEGAVHSGDDAAIRSAKRLAEELAEEELEFVGATILVLNEARDVV